MRALSHGTDAQSEATQGKTACRSARCELQRVAVVLDNVIAAGRPIKPFRAGIIHGLALAIARIRQEDTIAIGGNEAHSLHTLHGFFLPGGLGNQFSHLFFCRNGRFQGRRAIDIGRLDNVVAAINRVIGQVFALFKAGRVAECGQHTGLLLGLCTDIAFRPHDG